MVAMDGLPSISQQLLYRLGTMAERRAKRKANTRPRTWVQATIRLILHLAGFSCLTIAAWSFTFWAGMAVAGISCFVLSWLSTSSLTTDDNSVSTMHRRT